VVPARQPAWNRKKQTTDGKVKTLLIPGSQKDVDWQLNVVVFLNHVISLIL